MRRAARWDGAERTAAGIDTPIEVVVGGDRLLVAAPMLRRVAHGPPAVS